MKKNFTLMLVALLTLVLEASAQTTNDWENPHVLGRCSCLRRRRSARKLFRSMDNGISIGAENQKKDPQIFIGRTMM